MSSINRAAILDSFKVPDGTYWLGINSNPYGWYLHWDRKDCAGSSMSIGFYIWIHDERIHTSIIDYSGTKHDSQFELVDPNSLSLVQHEIDNFWLCNIINREKQSRQLSEKLKSWYQ